MFRKTNLLIFGCFLLAAASLSATAPTFLMNSADAAVTRAVQSSVQSSGSGTDTCPDGSTVSGISTRFAAAATDGSASGYFQLFAPSGAQVQATVNTAQISHNNFKISGIVTTDTICPSSVLSTAFSANGPCGSGVTVQYATANGERATIPDVTFASCMFVRS